LHGRCGEPAVGQFMSDQIFLDAYARVRNAYSEEAWLALDPRQITAAIYREIRLLDAERLRSQDIERAE